MALENLFNHADAELIAAKIEAMAGTTPGTNDGDTAKLPSHADGTRMNTALTALGQKRTQDLAGKGDNLELDESGENPVLKLKSGNTVLDQVTLPKGGGGGGVAIGDVTGITISTTGTSVSLSWTDPNDVVLSGITLAEWKGTKVVRKVGSAPTRVSDGTLVVDSKTRNAYSSQAYTDTGLSYDTTYYYRFFPYTDGITTDGSSEAVTPRRIVITTVPSQDGAVEYDGTQKTAAFSDFDSSKLDVTGNTGTNAGSYTATFTPKEGYCWSDYSITGKDVTWTLSKKSYAAPVQSGSLVYDGTQQTASFTGYDSNTMSVSGNTGTAAGSYTATFTLSDTDNTKWSATDNASIDVTWSINDATVIQPTVTGTTKTYNGSAQGPSVSAYDSNIIQITGDSATDAGSYTLIMTLLNANYKWSDTGTSEQRTFSWTINKAAGAVTLSKNTITLSGNATSDTVTISGATGAITITSGTPAVATVSPDTMTAPGGTLTVTSPSKKSGTSIITVSVAASTNYEATSATISFTGNYSQIFGVSWDGSSSSKMSRTDSAASFTDPSPAVNNGSGSSPFDSYMPWSGMERVTDANAGTLVRIPKFWYKWTKSGNTLQLQISNGEENGFSVAPAFMDRGDGKGERDEVFVGAYHCASDYKSQAGGQPQTSQIRAAFRSSIHNLGSNIWEWDYAMLVTIWMLYLVEYADWNSQATIGYGCSSSNSKFNMGATDSMQFHTGTSAASRTTYGSVRYRWIEGLWDNVFDWVDGIYFSGADIYIIKNPSQFSDTANGTKAGTRPTASSWITNYSVSSASGLGWVIYPNNSSGGSDSTYICDYCNYNASGVVLRAGGYYDQSQDHGLFCLYGAASYSDGYIGSRLQKLP